VGFALPLGPMALGLHGALDHDVVGHGGVEQRRAGPVDRVRARRRHARGDRVDQPGDLSGGDIRHRAGPERGEDVAVEVALVEAAGRHRGGVVGRHPPGRVVVHADPPGKAARHRPGPDEGLPVLGVLAGRECGGVAHPVDHEPGVVGAGGQSVVAPRSPRGSCRTPDDCPRPQPIGHGLSCRPVDNRPGRTPENAKTARYRYVAGRSRGARWEGFEPPAA
jgi:hypothetical protein